MDFTGERFIPDLSSAEMHTEHLQRYEFAQQFVKGKVVLDAAFGEGYGSYMLSEKAQKVYGIDISNETVVHAKGKYVRGNLFFEKGSVTDLFFLEDNSIDVVVSFETIEHVDYETQQSFLKEIKRVLKKSGILIMSTPNKAIYSDAYNYKNPFHVKEFYIDEYKEFLGRYFKNNVFFKQFVEVANIIGSRSDLTKINDNFCFDNSKYIISISSNYYYDDNIFGNVFIENNSEYQRKVDRIIELQNEQEDRNEHIKKLDENIFRMTEQMEQLIRFKEELEKKVSDLSQERDFVEKKLLTKTIEINQVKEELSKTILELEKTNKLYQENKKELFERKKEIYYTKNKVDELEKYILNQQVEYNNTINELNASINNKKGHIQLLLESDRELENIKNSLRWRIVNSPFKIVKKIFPRESKGYLFIKLTRSMLRNPKVYLRKLNFDNLRKLIRMSKREGINRVFEKIDQFDTMYQSQTEEIIVPLKIERQNYEKIKVPYYESIEVSIIIPVFNQFEYTYNCIESIIKNTTDIQYEIILADDQSQDETKNINDYVEGVNIIRNQKNIGFILNCNNASKYSRGKYLYFLNNDTNVLEGAIKELLDTFLLGEDIGLVGSKLVYPNGRLQEAGGIFWDDASAWNYGHASDPSLPEYNYTKEADYISGASIMIPKQLWDNIGGFDKRYVPAYCEDSDLAFEVRKKGYKVVYQPKSVVIHYEGISNGTDINLGVKAYQVENQKKFYKKWVDVLKQDHFKNGEDVFLARDRSFHKKTILVIDHYVPHFDKDAGSRTVYQYLKLFLKVGLNVKFIGDNYFKHEPYTSELERMGIEVLYGEYYSNNWKKWIKENAKYIDFVFMNRPHITKKYIGYIKKNTSAKLFYYGHDLHYLREMREYELKKDESMLIQSEESKKNEYSIMRQVDYVYYPSEVEVSEIKKNDNSILAKPIQAYIYDDIPRVNYSENIRNGLLFVGGFSHKPNVDAVLWFTKEVFPLIQKEIPDLIFNIVGSNPTKEILSLSSSCINVTGYVTDKQLDNYYLTNRMVVVPLRYGAGIKGKVIEAMSNSVPIVTTSIGSEGIMNAEELFLIADSPEEFAQKIIDSYNDQKFLLEISSKYFTYMENNFSFESAWNCIKTDFDI